MKIYLKTQAVRWQHQAREKAGTFCSATTYNKTSLGITTFSIMTLRKMCLIATLSIMTFSKMCLTATLSIMTLSSFGLNCNTQHKPDSASRTLQKSLKRYKFQQNFFLRFSEKIFSRNLQKIVLQMPNFKKVM
jgi:hypothetical protein